MNADELKRRKKRIPVCPKCGSAAVSMIAKKWRKCSRCKFEGKSEYFMVFHPSPALPGRVAPAVTDDNDQYMADRESRPYSWRKNLYEAWRRRSR